MVRQGALLGVWREEEASVAGESPDKSKQHGSSEEPTSGSGAAVPVPTKAGDDPRLVIAGEKVRVDQATAVFSTRGLRGTTGVAVDEGGAAPADTADTEKPEKSAESEKSAEPEKPAEAEKSAEAEKPAEGEEPEKADSDGDTGAGGDSAAGMEPEAPAAEETSEAEEASEGGSEGEEASGSAGEADDSAKSEDVKASRPAVDQPTAVFKARRPAVDQPTTMLKLGGAKVPKAAEKTDEPDEPDDSGKSDESAKKPAVDQPTTMLKLGGATKPSDKPSDGPSDKPAPAWAAKSPASDGDKQADGKQADDKQADGKQAIARKPDESEAERTSKFVALKSLDEPKPQPAKPESPKAEPKPKPAAAPADATAALPQVGPERTAQQPLPPKPPLDLLAELTNTPPPPETPVRTIVRRIKIWTPLVVLLAVIFAIVQAVRPLPAASLALTAEDTYTFGGKLDLPWPGQGQSAIEVDGVGLVGTDGVQAPKPIASVTKIMTAYVILQDHPLKGAEGGPSITADQQAEDDSKKPDESTAAMRKGQQFTERQTLEMLMIPSGNNVARLLARWDSDNKTFVGKMNAAAKKLGMTKTTYTDPSGLDSTTVSTAVDQLKLAKAAMHNPVFREVVGMGVAHIPGLDKPIYTTNDLLVKGIGVIGLKTGSSTPAGGDLVWAATKVVGGKTQTIYGAVLNQHAPGILDHSLKLALSNSEKLISKIQDSLTTATIVKKGEVVGYVDDQLGGKTPVVATQNMTAVGWPGLKTRLTLGDGGQTVPHEAKAGTVVGRLTVGDDSSRSVNIPVALQKDLTEPGYGEKFTRLG